MLLKRGVNISQTFLIYQYENVFSLNHSLNHNTPVPTVSITIHGRGFNTATTYLAFIQVKTFEYNFGKLCIYCLIGNMSTVIQVIMVRQLAREMPLI